MESARLEALNSMSQRIQALSQHVRTLSGVRSCHAVTLLKLPTELQRDVVEFLSVSAQVALIQTCLEMKRVHGFGKWDRLRNDPGERANLLLLLEHESPRLFANTKIRGRSGSEPTTYSSFGDPRTEEGSFVLYRTFGYAIT